MIIEKYVPIFLVVAASIVLAIVIVVLNSLLGLKRKTKEKLSVYESGVEPMLREKSRISVKYYLVAILFIIFDIEIIFMYPWAVAYKELDLMAIVPMITFVVVLFVGYIYIIKKKALEWN